MARAKRKSKIIPKAEVRLAGLLAIDDELDFGNGFSVALFQQSINQVQEQLNEYNTLLSKVDGVYLNLLRAERKLSSLEEKMLLNVAVIYGRDSIEYEMAGGKRRKKSPEELAKIVFSDSEES